MKATICLMLACLAFTSSATFMRLDAQIPVDPNAPNAPLTPDLNIPAPLNPQPVPSHLEFLQRILNGLSDEAGIPPTAIANGCLDENSAEDYLKTVREALNEISQGAWIELPETIYELKEGISEGVQTCLANDAGLKGIWDAYNIADLGLANLYVKFATYAIDGNYDILVQNLTDIYSVYQRGQYEIVGRMIGQLLKTVVAYDPNADLQNQETVAPSLVKMYYDDGWNHDSHYNNDYDSYDNRNDYNDYHDYNYDNYGDHH